MKDVHKEFYAKDPNNDKEADVTHIIPRMKKSVLTNVIIAFTDVIPKKIKDPTLSWIWQMATSFGAVCSMDLTGKTTHLIAVKVNIYSLNRIEFPATTTKMKMIEKDRK